MKAWILYENDMKDDSARDAYEVRRLKEEGEKLGVDVKVVNPHHFEILVETPPSREILIDGKPSLLPDVLIPRTLINDSKGYRARSVMRHLELLDVRLLNGTDRIDAAVDKLHTHEVLAASGIASPPTMLARYPVNVDMVETQIGFPVVVKTLQGTLGTGVFLAENRQSFLDVMDLVSEVGPNVRIILQKFVSSSHGRDLRIVVCGGKIVAAMERRAGGNGFKANITTGGTGHPFIPNRECAELALRTARALGLDLCGVDLLFTEGGGYTVCEVNPMPGFKGVETYCKVNVPAAIYAFLLRKTSIYEKIVAPFFGRGGSRLKIAA